MAERIHVIHVINTSGVIYDDRLCKEVGTLAQLGAEVEILVLETENRARTGTTPAGVPYRAIALLSRRVFRRAAGLPAKVAETYARFLLALFKTPRRGAGGGLLWLHNLEMIGFLPLARLLFFRSLARSVVWDLHELPPTRLLASPLGCRFLRWAAELSDRIVVANQERLDYLVPFLGERCRPKMHVLQNFPPATFRAGDAPAPPPAFVDWLDGEPFLLFQGRAVRERRSDEVVAAAFRIPTHRLLILGPIDDNYRSELRERWGDAFDRKVFVTGFVPQADLLPYIDPAALAVVLYASTTPNNHLCAPNRLYQPVCRGVPVVAGSNPPMAAFVRATGSGVTLRDDGADTGGISNAIQTVLADREAYAAAARRAAVGLDWESQGETLRTLLRGAPPPPA